jgi:chromosome partitioning protein
MKTLAIISQKGGVGKTTLATCLAVAAESDGKKTAIFDLDPQATASFWKDIRQAVTPAVTSIQPIRLPAMQQAARESGADLTIIDGPAVARDVAFEAARAADFVLIPTKTAVFDTMSRTHTLEVVRQCGKPFSVVLTFVPPVGKETQDAIEAASALGAPICPVMLGHRKAYFRAQATGLAVQEYEPEGKAAMEISRLYEYTHIQLYGQNSDPEKTDDDQFLASGT